jgi:tRNA A37 threonylcarbamoyladenosine modification protein TsaB
MIVLINPIASPLQIGYYRDDRLWKTERLEGKVSDVLLPALEAIVAREDIERIIYVHGPGSNMGIKLTYIALATLEHLRAIPFAACSGFELNGARPIRAMGQLYFVKEKETIITQKFDEPVPQEYGLPERLSALPLAPARDPLYILPAV